MLRGMSYPGGKGNVFQHIINVLPKHRTYIETHLGGGAVMRQKKAAARSIGVDIDPLVIAEWKSKRPDCCELVCTDAVQFIRAFPFSGDEVLYADPPYWPSTRRRGRVYRHEYTEHQHFELLNELKKLPCAVLLSGYQNEAYENALAGWRSITFFAPTHKGLREETLWFNYSLTQDLHDFSFLGSNYREREAIRRRQGTLRQKIARLCPQERASLVSWLVDQYPLTVASSAEQDIYA